MWLIKPLILSRSTCSESQGMRLLSSLYTTTTTEIKQVICKMPKICLPGHSIIYFCAWLKVFCYFLEGWEQEQHSAECQNNFFFTIFLEALQTKVMINFRCWQNQRYYGKGKYSVFHKYGLSEFDSWNFLHTTKSNVMNINPVSTLKKKQKYCKLDLSILNTEVI